MASSVYLIFGEDEYIVSTKAKETVESLVPPEDRTLGLEIIDGKVDTVDAAVAAIVKCDEALRTMGFFGNRKMVWFRDVSFLAENTLGKSEIVKSRVNELAAMIKGGLAPGQILMVTSAKVDKRFAFYKACEGAGEVHEFAVPDKSYMAERQAGKRLDETLSQMGLTMKQNVRDAFLGKVGTDSRQIVNEIGKLIVFIGERRDVRLSDIEAVTSMSRGALAWDLADAVGRRELGRALEILRRLIFNKQNPIFLTVVLGNRIRELMIYREALDKGWLAEKKRNYGKSMVGWGNLPAEVDTMFSNEFIKDPRTTHPYRVGLLAEQAKLFSRQELEKSQQAVMDAHVKLVSSAVPQPMVLELLLIKMLGEIVCQRSSAGRAGHS